MTATVHRLPLTPDLAEAECRDLAKVSGLPPAIHAEHQMEQAIKRHDYRAAAVYTAAHARLTTKGTSA